MGQRQVIEKSETKETTKEEKTLQKDETGEKFLTVVSYCCVIKSSSLMHIRISNGTSEIKFEVGVQGERDVRLL